MKQVSDRIGRTSRLKLTWSRASVVDAARAGNEPEPKTTAAAIHSQAPDREMLFVRTTCIDKTLRVPPPPGSAATGHVWRADF